MQPILFWIVGSISLLAGLVVVGARRPARSVQALVVVMSATAVCVFLLAATLLASEMLLVTAGAAVLVWVVLVRPGKLRLGTPGRARLNITRLVAFFVAVWLGTLLLWAPSHSTGASQQPVMEASLGTGFGFWMAIMLVGSAAATAWLVVSARRRADEQDEQEGEP